MGSGIGRALVGSALSFSVLIGGCATQQPERGSFFRTAQTAVGIESNPSGSIYLDNRLVGVSPTTFNLDYEQEVQRNVQKVTYWETQPGLAVLLTILSLGLYLPFSLIPVDQQTSLVPMSSYRNNHFEITVDSLGYEQWRQEIAATGERNIHFEPQLVKKAKN